MGLKDIFRKEEKFLGEAKDLPELASEQLSDDYTLNIPRPDESEPQAVKETPRTPAPNNLDTNPEPNRQIPHQAPQAVMNQQVPQTMQQPLPVQHYPMLNNPYPFMYHYPMQFPQNFFPNNSNHNNFSPVFHPQSYQSVMSDTNFEKFGNAERGPLRKLLSELDRLEGRWHSLSSQKTGLEKELKYLESEIEHKMKLLRTHLAIANESNVVNEGDEFHVCDGQVLRSRADLEAVASSMNKQVFDHHVGPGWNDFESWAANCLHDYALARRLKTVKNVVELQTALKKY